MVEDVCGDVKQVQTQQDLLGGCCNRGLQLLDDPLRLHRAVAERARAHCSAAAVVHPRGLGLAPTTAGNAPPVE